MPSNPPSDAGRRTVVVSYARAADDAQLEPLRARFPGFEFVTAPYPSGGATSSAEPSSLSDDDVAVWRRAEVALSFRLPPPAHDVAPNLRWLQGIGAGIDHLADVGLADHVVVTNAAGVAAAPIAEFAIGRLLQFWKRFPELDAAQRDGRWKPRSGRTVDGMTLGVIGLGAIGSAVAVRGRAFGMTVIGTRRSYTPGQQHDAVDELFGPDDLHSVLGRCDAVVMCAPGTPDTENLFDAAAFAAMQPGALFCNVGRGTTVDEPALLAALESGHLGGAALDVTRVEPLPADDPLWSAPNLLLSAHCSTALDRYTDLLLALFAENLDRYTRGEALHNVVDRTAGY